MVRVLALAVVLVLVGTISAQSSYKGCYGRKWGTFRTRETSDDMTNQKCVDICAKEDKPYAGTYETKCGCGSLTELERLGDPTDASECSSACGGDASQTCGQGNGRLTVWSTGKGKREMSEMEELMELEREVSELEAHHQHQHHQ